MAVEKVLQKAADGTLQEYVALDSSAGAGSAGKLVALDSGGKVNANMMPSGIGAEQVAVTAATSLAQYDLVNIYLDGETLKARKADGGTNKYRAHAFCPEAIESAATGNIQMTGLITGTGFTPGARQFLSDTPGTRTETALSGAGKIHQVVGYAVSETQWRFEAEEPITLAA